MMKKLSFLFFLFTFCISLSVYAQPKLSIQGVIKNSDGSAVEDGGRDITFKLYETDMGGTPVWEETQSGIPVTGGIYSALLGAEEPLDPAFDVPYYLGVSIDGGNELQPRTLLTAAPTALSLIGQDNVFPNSGNVGIGTSTPNAQLDVDGDVNASGNLTTAGSFTSGGNILTDGSVGIGGITNPEQALQISGNLLFKNINPQGGSASIYFEDTDNGTGPMNIGYIDDGNTSLSINGGGLFITSGSLTTNGATIVRNNLGNNSGVVNATTLQWGRIPGLGATTIGNHRGVGSGGFEFAVYGPLGDYESTVLNINAIGGDATLQGSLTQNSDRRLKKDITPLADVLEKITQLNGYNYKWKTENRSTDMQLGMIAQEVQAVFPELVTEDEQGMLSLNYIGLVPVLIEATKTQQTQIDQLQQQIDALVTHNNEQESTLWWLFWIVSGTILSLLLLIVIKRFVGNPLSLRKRTVAQQLAIS